MTSILCQVISERRKEQFDVAKLLCDLCCEECKLILVGKQYLPRRVSY